MIKIQLALMRVGEPELQAFVGKDVVKHLTLLHDVITVDKLADMLLVRHGADLFTNANRAIREAIFASLPADQAQELADLIAAPAYGDAYRRLAKLDCRADSETLQQLCMFFSVSLPVVAEEAEESAEALEG